MGGDTEKHYFFLCMVTQIPQVWPKKKALLSHSLQAKTEAMPSNEGKSVWQNTEENLPANFEANAKL